MYATFYEVCHFIVWRCQWSVVRFWRTSNPAFRYADIITMHLRVLLWVTITCVSGIEKYSKCLHSRFKLMLILFWIPSEMPAQPRSVKWLTWRCPGPVFRVVSLVKEGLCLSHSQGLVSECLLMWFSVALAALQSPFIWSVWALIVECEVLKELLAFSQTWDGVSCFFLFFCTPLARSLP